jgi:hypothetical protein
MKYTLKNFKAHIDSKTVVVTDVNILVSPTDWLFKEMINKETLKLNYTISQMNLIDIYGIFHPTTTQHTFFSAAHGTFSKIYHILGHKASHSKQNKIQMTSCILSDHNALKLELKNKNIIRKYANN